jgi:hypothetical protein
MIARWRIRKSRQRPYGASCGGLRGKPGRRSADQAAVPGRAAQFANLDKDPMERRAVGLAASRRTRGGSQGPVPGRAPQFANLDKDPMECRAVGLAAGRCARGGSQGPVPGRAAQFANLDNDPMERHAVGFAAGRCTRGGSQGPVPRRAAQFANLDKDPMERRAVGLAAGRHTKGGSQCPVPSERRNSRISTTTLWSAMRSAWRRPADAIPRPAAARDPVPSDMILPELQRPAASPAGTTAQCAPRFVDRRARHDRCTRGVRMLRESGLAGAH